MTMPYERYRAIVKTERFLKELLCDESLSRELRDKAYSCLRHYPTSPLLDLLSDAAPDILQSEFPDRSPNTLGLKLS